MGYGWIIVFLLVLLLGCGYVSWHVWQILPLAVVGKWIVVGALLLCIVCFFTNFILGLDNKPMPIAITHCMKLAILLCLSGCICCYSSLCSTWEDYFILFLVPSFIIVGQVQFR